MSSSLGSLVIASGVSTTFPAPNEGVKGIVIGNESGLTVTITMESGGVQKTLYPGTVDWYTVKPGFTGNIKINPSVILNNVSSWPASSLCFDAIGLNDPETAGQYPIQLNRNTNVGNMVNTVGGTSTAIQNDNNAAGTSIAESTVSGDGSSAVSLTNDGTLVLGTTLHKGSITLKGAAGSNALSITAGKASLDNGGITTDGSGNISKVGNVTSTGNLSVQGTSSLDNGNITSSGAGVLTLLAELLNEPPTNFPATSGGTGNVDCGQPIRGSALKVVIINFNALKNGTSVINWALPAAFTKGGIIWAGSVAGFGLAVSSTLQNISVISTLGSNMGSGASGGTGAADMFGASFAEIEGAFDTIQFSASNSSAHTGFIIIIGR